MIAFLTSFVSLCATGAIMLFNGIRNAPEGYEDDSGFHLVWHNNDPGAADIACVWAPSSVHCAG